MSGPLGQGDDVLMRRAIALGMKGRGWVEPNPMVGCVIAKDGRVIGEGYHERYGGPHAEPKAMGACVESPQGATAYVTLEPCCHTDKQTPPCVPQLIEAKLARVVIGAIDPNPRVAGRGTEQLRSAGLTVDILNLPAARQLIAPFVARITHHRPYVTLKWAQSADGKVAGPGGRRVQISGPLSTRAIHELRARCDAIMVGVNTVLCDDPMLTVRLAEPRRPLIRVVLDATLRTPAQSRLVRTASEQKVIIYTSHATLACQGGARGQLEAAGVELRPAPEPQPGRLSLSHVLHDLGRLTLTHLLVEPGPTLAKSFLETGLWDRAWAIRSASRIDSPTAPEAPAIAIEPVAHAMLGQDRLVEYLNPLSEVMFNPDPSADFVMAASGSSPPHLPSYRSE